MTDAYKVECRHVDGPNSTQVTVQRPGEAAPRVLQLGPSLRIRGHSPTGFSWGYGGSGPAQLALALLMHVTGDVDVAVANYQRFKFAVLCQGSWEDDLDITFTDDDLTAFLLEENDDAITATPVVRA